MNEEDRRALHEKLDAEVAGAESHWLILIRLDGAMERERMKLAQAALQTSLDAGLIDLDYVIRRALNRRKEQRNGK